MDIVLYWIVFYILYLLQPYWFSIWYFFFFHLKAFFYFFIVLRIFCWWMLSAIYVRKKVFMSFSLFRNIFGKYIILAWQIFFFLIFKRYSPFIWIVFKRNLLFSVFFVPLHVICVFFSPPVISIFFSTELLSHLLMLYLSMIFLMFLEFRAY